MTELEASFTTFPNLYDLQDQYVKDIATSHTFSFDSHDVSPELIQPAFARLLRSYTGEQDVRYQCICVAGTRLNQNSRTNEAPRRESSAFDTGISASRGAGILLDAASDVNFPARLRLELLLHRDSKAFTIRSLGAVPRSHLKHIAAEFQYKLQIHLLSEPLTHEGQSRQLAARAVINTDAPSICGPSLLHDLALSSPQGNIDWAYSFAIEYYEDPRLAKPSYSLTYGELEDEVSRICNDILVTLDARRSSPHIQPVIAVLLPQSVDLYIVLLAVLRSGCAFCPLQLDAPPERIRFVLEDTHAPIVLTSKSHRQSIPQGLNLSIISVSGPSNSTTTRRPPLRVVLPTDVAYVLYTSGSTGTPKGVPVSHSAASQSLLAHDAIVPPYQRFLQFASPTFDVSMFEIFFTFKRKATLIVCDRTAMLEDLPLVIRNLRVDACELTPTVAGTLIANRSNVPDLCLLLTIGEMLTERVVREFGANKNKDRAGILLAMYGPTEAAIHCTYQADFDARFKSSIIGLPLSTVSALVLAPSDQTDGNTIDPVVLEVGHVGELAIGGHQLADGYLNRPEQTSASFIELRPYGRIYRTGDRARLLPSGRFEVLGRIKDGQVKLRGQRIELGEIESVAASTTGSSGAVAIIIDGQLQVFAVFSDMHDSRKAEVLRQCRNRLPSFMVPADVVILTTLPRLASGKVDRKELEAAYRRHNSQANIEPGEAVDDQTQKLCEILSQLLNKAVGPATTLSSVGLDSLVAIRAASTFRRAGFDISVIDLLAAENAMDLRSAHITAPDTSPLPNKSGQDLQGTAKISEWVAECVPERTRQQFDAFAQTYYPCTTLQLAMLAETNKSPEAYWNTVEINLATNVKLDEIREWIDELAQENEILRTGFVATDDTMIPYAQVVWKSLLSNQISVSTINGDSQAPQPDLLHPIRFSLQTLSSDDSSSQDTAVLDSEVPLERSVKLVIFLHHAVYDGFTIDLLAHDLDILHRGEQLPSRPSFHEIIVHQYSARAKRQSEASSSAVSYWRQQMQGYTPLSIPNFFGRHIDKSMVDFKKGVHEISLELKPSHLEQCAVALGVSVQSFLQSALFFVLTSYLAGAVQDDAEVSTDFDYCLAVVTSGRELPIADIENIMGPCINTLPLRVNVGHARTVRDLLRMVHSGNRQMLAHSELSLGEISRLVHLRNSTPLCQALFVWQESFIRDTSSANKAVRITRVDDNLEFDLVLEAYPDRVLDKIELRFSFDSSVIPLNQVEILAAQVAHTAMLLTSGPDMGVAKIRSAVQESITQSQPASLPETFSIQNSVPTIPNFTMSLTAHFRSKVREAPDVIAVEFCDRINSSDTKKEVLTYSQLDQQSDALASRLLKTLAEVEKEELVAIIMEKSLDLYVAILAVLKTGRGYLPLTPNTPEQRINTILEESGIRHCVSSSAISTRLNLSKRYTVILTDKIDYSDGIERLNMLPDTTVADEHRLAFAIFTSGSTGKPKGVLVTQQNLHSNLQVLSDMYPRIESTTSSSGRLLQACSQAFDVSVFEIFFAWYTGMTLVSASNDTIFADIETFIHHLSITHLSLTPTVAALVHPDKVPTVKFLVTAGEAVTAQVKRRWSDRGLWIGYGPSETTNICTVQPAASMDHFANNIGPSFSNTSTFILSPDSEELVFRGAIGELCFGGDQVFRGYMNLPELTREKIIDHPTWGRIYRSRDLGRLLPNGDILFEGRIEDGQVKIRGQRVELSEIDSLILENVHVKDSCTVVLESENPAQGRQLASLWVPQDREAKSDSMALNINCVQDLVTNRSDGINIKQDIIRSLGQKLHSYMQPTIVVAIPSMPRTTQGKIDRRLLRSLCHEILKDDKMTAAFNAQQDFEESDSDEGPLSGAEKAIRQALTDLLRLASRSVFRHTSFFSLGLDSISAISLARKLQQTLGVSLNVSTILQHASISSLALHVDSLTTLPRSDGVHLGEQSPRVDVNSIYSASVTSQIQLQVLGPLFADPTQRQKIIKVRPCVPIQAAMITASLTRSDAYCNITVLRLSKQTDVAKLRQCWSYLVDRHEILRTCFVTTDDERFQIAQAVLSQHEMPWAEATSESEDLSRRKSEMTAEVLASVSQSSPPYRLEIVKAGHQTLLSFACHHALYDATAISTLLKEVEQLYKQDTLSSITPLEPFISDAMQAQEDDAQTFWKRRLEHVTTVILPSSRGTKSEVASKLLLVSLSSAEAFCRSANVSLLAMCQSALAKLLASLFATPDVCFGNVSSGRTYSPRPDAAQDLIRLVMPTFNTIPVRVNLGGQSPKLNTNESLSRTLHDMNIDALPYQLTSLQTIINAPSFRPSGQSTGLFSTLLLLQQEEPPLDADIWALAEESGDMNFPLIFELIPSRHDDSIACRLHFHTPLFEDTHAVAILDSFSSAFQTCIRYPGSAPLDLEVSRELVTYINPLIEITRPTRNPGSDKASPSSDHFTSQQQRMQDVLATFANVSITQITLDTSIYELGIDSLSAIRLTSYLNKQPDLRVSLAQVLSGPKLRDLSLLWNKQSQRDSDGNLAEDFASIHTEMPLATEQLGVNSPIDGELLQAIFACTPAQDGMLAQFINTRDSYVNALSVQLAGHMTSERVISSLRRLTAEHPILRTGFAVSAEKNSGSNWNMLVYGEDQVELDIIEAGGPHFELEAWRSESARQFNASLHRPPWRAFIDKTSANGSVRLHIAILHSIFDAESLRQLFTELHDNDTTRDSRSFSRASQYIVAEAQASNSLILAERKAFWQKSISDSSSGQFPNLCPLQELHGEMQTVSLNCGSAAALRDKCKAQGITLMAAGQAAWAQILAGYLGESLVSFGSVFAGRDIAETETAMFPCIVTVPTVAFAGKCTMDLTMTLMDFNAKVRQHLFTPMTSIQKWTQVKFDTLFAFQNLDGTEEPPYTIVEERPTAEFSVSLELEVSRANMLDIRLVFRSDVLPIAQAHLLARQYAHVLQSIADEDILGKTDALSPMHDELLSVSRPTHELLDSPVVLLHQFIQRQARQKPDAVALRMVQEITDGIINDQTWTYSQLINHAQHVARLIQDHGVKSRSMIAICFDKCPEAYFGILGVLLAGCSYVAVDPAAPMARKQFILEDSGAALVLSAQRDKGSLRSDPVKQGAEIETFPCPVVWLDELESDWTASAPRLDPVTVTPEDLCYCLYTSGSTGTPKCCMITHQNAVQVMRAFSVLFADHWAEDSRWLQFASFHFDVSVLEQYWTWSEGLQVVAVPRDIIFQDLPGTISSLQITHIDLTPSLALLLSPEEVPSLCRGVFITGGESLRQEILDKWGPEEVIYNGYGPTEATIGITMYQRVPKNGKPSNIGRCYPNGGAFVLEPGTEKVLPRGMVGELCVFGALVCKGYLNRSDLTASKFPYAKTLGQRIYRTGDLVKMLHDGTFDFVGRIDDQVKLRGQRLEIGEINAVIRSAVPAIQDVSTLVLKHSIQRKDQLVSFVSLLKTTLRGDRPQVMFDSKDQREAIKLAISGCKEALPPYMVPTHIIPVSHIPLTVNNKLDTRTLQTVYDELRPTDLRIVDESSDDMAERSSSPAEIKVIASICSIVSINDSAVTQQSNVFDLGFDSISIIKLAQQLVRDGFTNAQPSTILKNPIIRNLAAQLDSETGDSSNERAVIQAKQRISACERKNFDLVCESLSIDRDGSDIEAIVPCTPLQTGILARIANSDDPIYLSSFRMRLSSDCDEHRLKQAWQTVQDDLQILRTSFIPSEDGYLQIIKPRQTLPWVTVKAKSPSESCDKGRNSWLSANRDRLVEPFRLALCHSNEATVLLVNMCHAIYDGISLNLLFDRVFAAYTGERRSDTVDFTEILPHGPLMQLQDAAAFWQSKVKPHESFVTHHESTHKTPTTKLLTRNIKVDNSLERLRQTLGVTMQSVMQACWCIALSPRLQGLVTIGVITSGRALGYPGADSVVGPLFNTLPFQVCLNPSDRFEQAVKQCHKFNIDTQPFQHTSLSEINKALNSKSGRGLFDSLFVLQQTPNVDCSKNEFWELEDDTIDTSDYPLAFEVERRDHDLHITVAYQDSLPADEVESFVSTFIRVLNAVSGDPSQTLESIVGAFEPKPPVKDPSDRQSNGHVNGIHEEVSISSTEQFIIGTIATLAKVPPDQVRVSQSIFELGLDSIDVLKLSSRLKKADLMATSSQIMRNPRIRDIAKVVGQYTQNSSNNKGNIRSNESHSTFDVLCRQLFDMTEDFKRDSIETIWPATPLQEGMLSAMSQSELEQYYNHDVLELSSHIDVNRLKAAIRCIVDAEPILRSTFVPVDVSDIKCGFAQVAWNPSSELFNWAERQVSDLDHLDEVLAEVTNMVKKSQGTRPLLQFTWLRGSPTNALVISIPHAMYDGWSLVSFHNVVQGVYQGAKYTPVDSAEVVRGIFEGQSEEARTFWRSQMRGVRPCLLAIMFENKTSAYHFHERSAITTVSLAKQFCKNVGVTLQALGQAAWTVVLATRKQSLEVVYGVVVSGRETEEAQQVMFPTMNTLAFPSLVLGSSKEMLHATQETISSIREHQHFPLRDAVALSKAGGKLFDTLFTFQSRPAASNPNETTTEPLYRSIGGRSRIEIPVAVEMEAINDELILRTTCDGSYLNESQTHQLLDDFNHVIEHLCDPKEDNIINVRDDKINLCDLHSFTLSTSPTQNGTHDQSETKQAPGLVDPTDTATLGTIRKVLSEVASVPEAEINRDSTLFHMGLDSISAIKVSGLLRKHGVALSVSQMLRASSLAAMAQVAGMSTKTKATPQHRTSVSMVNGKSDPIRSKDKRMQTITTFSHGQIGPEDIEAIYPANSGQFYMLATWSKTHGAQLFSTFKYRMSGSADRAALSAAWTTLVKSTPILRTAFALSSHPSEPVLQMVLREVPYFVLDVTESNEIPSDVDQPWVRLSARKDGNDWDVTLRIHHALYDAVNHTRFMLRLETLLRQNEESTSRTLSRPSIESIFEEQSSLSTASQAKSFWTTYLSQSTPPLCLSQPQGLPESRFQLFSEAWFLDVRKLQTKHRAKGITLQALFFAAYATVYQRLVQKTLTGNHSSPSEDTTIGIYLSNRSLDIEGSTDAPAPTVNLLPVRIRTSSPNNTLTALAKQVQHDLGEIGRAEHATTGLWQINEWTNTNIDTFVNFLNIASVNEGRDEDTSTEEETQSASLKSNDTITLTQIHEHFLPEKIHTLPASSKSPTKFMQEIQKTSWAQSYPFSFDIEVALRNGALDLGLFGWAGQVSMEDGKWVAAELKKVLMEWVEDVN